jgi:predicted TIM-barrel fold metal-dependent hydrolase
VKHSFFSSAALFGAVLVASTRIVAAEDDIRELKLREWEPRSMLVTRATIVETPRFPVIDIHNHLGGGKDLTPERVRQYLTEMDEAGVRTVVNLDGGWDERLRETLGALDQAHPGRFLTFALVNFDGIDDDDWTDREVKRLEDSFRAGARGLKIDKRLGLRYRYKSGKLMPVDDPKLDRIWETCGRHRRPVVIHVSDPAAFFTPLDRFNERWHELNANPNWLFFGDQFPERRAILDQLHSVIARHSGTTFVNTHFGNNAEDLAAVGDKLDKYPNMFVDIDARISELGRQPYSARKFFLKYQDRILFGTDTPPKRDAFRIYYRFLETDDEYFDSAASHHRQGFWMIYGLFLPPDVLEKIYFKNAARILGLAAPDSKAGGERAAGPATNDEKTPAGVMRVPRAEDFEVTGDGQNKAWSKAEWEKIPQRTKDGLPYESRIKLMYSPTGLYVLFDAGDKKLSATIAEDFQNLWEEDVFEVFLWPDEKQPVYFEYEISPLGQELPILVPNFNGKFLGWRPWHYEGGRKTRKATAVTGGTKQPRAAITGWTAEVFIPYELLNPLANLPPEPGTTWRANFYRVDYDDGKTTRWTWAPVGPSFHEFQKFGKLVFD